MSNILVIPARLESVRFKNKLIEKVNGKTIIEIVYERVKDSLCIDDVIIATDSEIIKDIMQSVGANVVMTPKDCKNGTERIGYALKSIGSKHDIVVNIQADEPMVDLEIIDLLVKSFDDNTDMVTLKREITKDIDNPNFVKVVTDKNNNAMYFSRSKIPYNRDNDTNVKYYKHLGFYAYRQSFLQKYLQMQSTVLELSEKLEQLRILENGYKIKVIETDRLTIDINTKEDLEHYKSYIGENKNV